MKVKPSLRSGVALAAIMKTGAGPHRDRRLPRSGARNEERELLDEYDEWRLDMREVDDAYRASGEDDIDDEEEVQLQG